MAKNTKTEHSGAKNGDHYDHRVTVKKRSKKIRRQVGKQQARER